jgi:hypothetical protein
LYLFVAVTWIRLCHHLPDQKNHCKRKLHASCFLPTLASSHPSPLFLSADTVTPTLSHTSVKHLLKLPSLDFSTSPGFEINVPIVESPHGILYKVTEKLQMGRFCFVLHQQLNCVNQYVTIQNISWLHTTANLHVYMVFPTSTKLKFLWGP